MFTCKQVSISQSPSRASISQSHSNTTRMVPIQSMQAPKTLKVSSPAQNVLSPLGNRQHDPDLWWITQAGSACVEGSASTRISYASCYATAGKGKLFPFLRESAGKHGPNRSRPLLVMAKIQAARGCTWLPRYRGMDPA